MSNLKTNFLYNSAYQLLLAVSPLITTPYLSRTIGAEGNGAFTFTQSVTNYFVLVAVLGMGNYGVRTIAECGDNRELRSKVFWEAYGMSALVGVIVVLAYIGYVVIWGQELLPLFVCWGMWLLASVLDVTWLLWGCEEFRIPTLRNFATKIASIVCIFVFVHNPSDVWIYVAAIAGSFLLNSILIWPYVRRYVDWVRPTWKGLVSHLIPNLTLFVPVLATSLYLIMDKVMLGAMAGLGETGLYDYAEKVSKMPMAVITALGAVVLPKMTNVVASGRLAEAKKLVGTTMWFMQACAMALSFGIAAVAPEFVPVFLGDNFEACVPLLRILCAIIPLICATNVMGIQWLLPTKRDAVFTYTVAAGAVINVIINVLTIPIAGAMGASIATVVAETTVLFAQAWAVRNELNLGSYLRGATPFIAIGIIMLIAIRFYAGVIGRHSHSILGLVSEVLIGAVVYIVLSYFWCFITKSSRLKEVFPKLARW